MSWFNQASLSSFAKTALSTAQKSIDKVLDIREDEEDTSPSSSGSSGSRPPRSSGSTRVSDQSSTRATEDVDASNFGKGNLRSSSHVSLDDGDSFFSEFLAQGSDPVRTAKPKRTPAKQTPAPEKVDEAAREAATEKAGKQLAGGKTSKVKSKPVQDDSDDSDERGKERRAVRFAKKPHPGQKKSEAKESKSETILTPLHVDVGSSHSQSVLPRQGACPKSSDEATGLSLDRVEVQKHEEQTSKVEASTIDADIVRSTDSFLLVKSGDVKEFGEEGESCGNEVHSQSMESSNSTSTGTVEADEKLEAADAGLPLCRKSSDVEVKSESENTDEQTSVKSDSDFVVINEHTASEQSSVYLYDTRESPENESPKHYSSSSNGKRSPTDSDFSIISEGRFNDMPDSIHSAAQAQDVGNLVEQASIALMQRASPSYSADVESEDQDDKTTPSSSTDERPRSGSEESSTVRDDHNSTPTPNEEGQQKSGTDAGQVEVTPRLPPDEEDVLSTTSPKEELQESDALQPEKLLKKLAEMAQVLEAREAQIIHLSQQNGELQDSVSVLKTQVHESEEARKSESYDLDELTKEFTQRISAMEKKLQTANRERDQFKKDSQKMQKALDDIEKSDTTGKLLAEKDEQITELLTEGEKLSKQQLQNSTIIKKLRAKEKETDKLVKSQKEQLQQAEGRVEHLEEVLNGKEDVEKKQKDAIKTLNLAVERQEKEIASLKTELDEAREKVRSTQHALDGSYKELAELHRSMAAKESKVQESALSAEMNAKEELKLALERSQLEARRQQEGLLLQVNDLQLSLNRAEQQSARKEESFRQEVADLQQRLQEEEARNQELSQSVSAATRPLLRQIENLQSTFNAQSSTWEQVERSLTERLADAQSQLAAATERERAAQEGALGAGSKMAALESQLAMTRQEKSRLSALLEVEKARLENLEETKTRDFHHMENQLQSYVKALGDAQKEKVGLEKQLELEKMRLENERKKLAITQEALEEKEKRLQQEEMSGSHSPGSRASTPIHSEMRPIFNPSLSRTPSQGEILERTMSSSMIGSVYDSVVSGSAASIIESLQSQLKQREGEIVQLQNEIYQLERTRSSMAEEIVKLTNQTETLESEVSNVPELRIQLKDLQHRYNAVLQMYGEKAEEVEELKLDLQDVKEMYRQQIEDLIRGST
ncbi:TATA element modulatory factor-like [Diadema antillarum]|uniref:TATA element modulatory factor-like n=1 Tax=Diadema antillarum TaxID=105358 RepID=UPI003A877EE4